jgi:Protein of unknown function (DUF3828)
MNLPTKVTAFAALLTIQLCSVQASRDQNAQAVDSATQFVRAIYIKYGSNGGPPSLFEENAGAIFHSSLIALAREDQTAVGPGEAGVIDYDPVCNCQDADVKFEHLKIQVEVATEDSSRANVTFTDENGLPETIVLVLRKENEQWRIYDIENHGRRGRPSLRAALEKEIQRLSEQNKSR